MTTLKYVGQNVERNDIRQKVRGKVRYLGDHPKGREAHARLILSTVAKGKILSMDLEEALKVPGVIKIYTPQDDPGNFYNAAMSFPDQPDRQDQRIFTDTPLFVGDTLGAVLGETEEAARKARDLVRITYHQEEPTVNPLKALTMESFRPGHPQVQEGAIAYGEEHSHKESLVELEYTVTTPRIHHAAMENHLCRSYMDYGDVLVVESPCQMIFSIRYVLSHVFNRPYNKIRVIKTPMGGTFGGKQEVVLEPACALMTLDSGRPVLLALDRHETIAATCLRGQAVGRVRITATKEGMLQHREVDMVFDAGAYATGGHRVTMAMGKKLSRLYRIPSQSYRGRTTFTNTTPNGACRGYGSPQAHTVTEIPMDFLARTLGMNPAELRRKNLVEPWDEDPAGGPPLGNAMILECLDRGCRDFRWDERFMTSPGEGRHRRGVGLACATHGNGYYGSPFPDFLSMALRICEDGSVLVNAGLHELGNGTLTMVAQVVGEVLDISPEIIYVSEGDTHLSPFDAGCVASRVTYVCGQCALEGAKKVQKLFMDQISRAYEVPMETIKFKSGLIFMESREAIPYGEAVCHIAKVLREEVGDYVHYKPLSNPASFGVHFAEVEVDTLTGLVKVTDFLAIHDVGRAINPQLLKGQIYGGVQMGIGMALMEELVWTPQGKLKTDSLSRYHMINTPDMPPTKILLVEEEEPGGPYGAKSIGEIATVPTAAAVVNGVNHALGTELTTLPVTPERVIEALYGK